MTAPLPDDLRDRLVRALHSAFCPPEGDACVWLDDGNGDPACLPAYTRPQADALAPTVAQMLAEREGDQ